LRGKELKTNFAREMLRFEGSARKVSYAVIKKFKIQTLNLIPLKCEEITVETAAENYYIYKTAIYTI